MPIPAAFVSQRPRWSLHALLFACGVAFASASLVRPEAWAQEEARQPAPCESLLQAQVPQVLEIGILEEALIERVSRVEEFRYLRETCETMGIRCWLFGGTAAGYGHYVKWDLQRAMGDDKLRAERFQYEFYQIYRSTQDADLVIDGSEDQARRVEAALQKKFPHLRGNRSVWEVRLLRDQRKDKLALLDNPDFQDQHSDSNSTGLIEVTLPRDGESAIRDLKDWTPVPGRRARFLEDIFEGRIGFYQSERHAGTARARQGLNPPIFSVVRFLTKAFQYELKIADADWKPIEQIVAAFDPEGDLKETYSRFWLIKNGKKLFQHAVNLEYAWDTLERLGLREKLMRVDDAQTPGSLAWWMNKVPLRAYPVGRISTTHPGLTAAELGITRVAHDTWEWSSRESIVRSHRAEANVFESRSGVHGENAFYGQGFYTRVGEKGARGTGITVRFDVDPDARDGSDFIYVPSQHYVVFRNKEALRVVPEDLVTRRPGMTRWERSLLRFKTWGAIAAASLIFVGPPAVTQYAQSLIDRPQPALSEVHQERLKVDDFTWKIVRQFIDKQLVFRVSASKIPPKFDLLELSVMTVKFQRNQRDLTLMQSDEVYGTGHRVNFDQDFKVWAIDARSLDKRVYIPIAQGEDWILVRFELGGETKLGLIPLESLVKLAGTAAIETPPKINTGYWPPDYP